MKINNLPEVFTAALPVLKEINEAGNEAFFVGGRGREPRFKRGIFRWHIVT